MASSTGEQAVASARSRSSDSSRKERGLSHESRMGSAIDLGGMDQKRVAEIDRPRRAGGQHFVTTSSSAVVQLSWAQARLPGRRKHPGNLQM